MKSCMGGWCTLRDKCPHYGAESDDRPAERMCLTGRDGVQMIEASPFRQVERNIFDQPNSRRVVEGREPQEAWQ